MFQRLAVLTYRSDPKQPMRHLHVDICGCHHVTLITSRLCAVAAQDHDLFSSYRLPSGPHSLIKEEFMQDCLQIDLPPHTDPYNQPRPVSVYPSMPLSPPGQTVHQLVVVQVLMERCVTSCHVSCRQQLHDRWLRSEWRRSRSCGRRRRGPWAPSDRTTPKPRGPRLPTSPKPPSHPPTSSPSHPHLPTPAEPRVQQPPQHWYCT